MSPLVSLSSSVSCLLSSVPAACSASVECGRRSSRRRLASFVRSTLDDQPTPLADRAWTGQYGCASRRMRWARVGRVAHVCPPSRVPAAAAGGRVRKSSYHHQRLGQGSDLSGDTSETQPMDRCRRACQSSWPSTALLPQREISVGANSTSLGAELTRVHPLCLAPPSPLLPSRHVR